MTKPKTVQGNLMVAQWLYPELPWYVNCGGGVQYDPPNSERKYFSLINPRDSQAALIKLHRDHGWKITEVTRGGQKQYLATGDGKPEILRPSLQALIVDVVERISAK